MESQDYFLYDFYLFRTHSFPLEAMFNLNEVFNKYEGNLASKEAIEIFKQYFSDPLFIEGIYFSSKDLFKILTDWLNGKILTNERTINLLRSLHRYYTRMSSRCTPFGAYSGCTTGDIQLGKTNIKFSEQKFDRRARFDMQFLNQYSEILSKESSVQEIISYFPNPTLYKLGDRYQYTEQTKINGRNQSVLSSIRSSQYINIVLESSKNGATKKDLLNAFACHSIGQDRLLRFIDQLIFNQVLVSDISPEATGDHIIEDFINRLDNKIPNKEIIEILSRQHKLLSSENVNLNTYISVSSDLKKTVNYENDFIQMDLYYNMESNNLNLEIVEEIAKTSEKLSQLVPPSISKTLREFIRKFTERYEEHEIPLLHAIDPNFGLGYGLASNGFSENMPLLDKVVLKADGEIKRTQKTAYQKLVDSKIKSFYKKKSDVIVLSDEDLRDLELNDKGIGQSQHYNAYIFGSILSVSVEELEKKNFKFLCSQLHAYSAPRLLGRFACGDIKLRKKIQQCIVDEENLNPDIIFAEVLYFPRGRGDNVVTRPKLRKFEIPCNTLSTSTQDHVINLNDLMVSVKDGRLLLRSKKHNKEVLPQITNAHNTNWGDPVYRFLSDVRAQNVNSGFSWEWLEYNNEPYLPRVEYKNFILSRAKWKINKFNINGSSSAIDIDSYLINKKDELSIPRFVQLVQDGDNELFIDLDNKFSRQQVCHRLKSHNVHLLELMTSPDNCFIQDEKGNHYSHQLIIPLGSKHPNFKPKKFDHISDWTDHKLKRSFLLGSEWTFFKIYGGNSVLETILIDLIQPELNKAIKLRMIDKWFFIRFNDPETHIRLRFHKSEKSTDVMTLIDSINRILDPLVESHQISKVSFDTYNREIERYGPETMIESESLFYHDSVSVLSVLDNYDSDSRDRFRWQLGLLSIDKIFDDFRLSLEERSEVIDHLRISFFKEFGNNSISDEKALEVSLNNKFRNDKNLIQRIISEGLIDNEIFPLNVFNKRSVLWNDEIQLIISKTGDRRKLYSLLRSYIHMALNRLILAKHRMHEMIIYHYLSKYYSSMIARRNKIEV